MAITILFVSFSLLLLMGVPVAFCLGLSSLATVIYLDIPPWWCSSNCRPA